jgi:uncharacterized cupin superfamily protein
MGCARKPTARSQSSGCRELIYIIEGEGKVYVDGDIKPMEAGNAVLFERNPFTWCATAVRKK